MLRIYQLTSTFVPNYIGGRESHVYELSRGLAQKGLSVTVLTGDRVPRAVESNLDFGVRVIRLPMWSVPLGDGLYFRIVPSVLKYLIQEKPELVHAHDYLHLTSYTAALYRTLKSTKFVLTLHSLPSFYNSGVSGKLVKASNIIAPLLLRKADALIFVSRFSLKIFSKIFGQYLKRKSFVVYPSFDSSTADSVLSRRDLLSLKEKLFGNKIVIFSAGRLESRKGFDDLIISIIHVANKLPNVILVIAGPDAGHSSRLQSLANQLGLEGKVRFAGPLPEEQLLTYMMCSDVFVLPSLEDNLPVILLKALYIGKPVVATNVGGIPEIITHGKNGLLVEPANPEQLAAAILRIVCNPELAATLQTQAKDSIRKRFSYHNMVCDTLSVYRSLL